SFFFFSSRRRHTRFSRDWSSDVCSSDLTGVVGIERFLYEPNGEAYNLFFVRPAVELDALEVVMFNPLDEHRFASHELDLLQYHEIGRASRRESVENTVVYGATNKKIRSS